MGLCPARVLHQALPIPLRDVARLQHPTLCHLLLPPGRHTFDDAQFGGFFIHIFQKFEPKSRAPCIWLQSRGFGMLQSTGAALLGSSATTQLLLSLQSCSPLCPDTAGLWGRTSLLRTGVLDVGCFARLLSLCEGLRGRKEVFLPSL